MKKTFFIFLASSIGAVVFSAIGVAYLLWKSNILPALYPLLKVSTHIEHSYIEPLSKEQLKERILSGLVETLDPHSAYLNATEYRKMTDDLQAMYGGIGITGKPQIEEGHILVQDVQENGPAFLAGMRKGDKILEVNGEPISTLKNEAFDKIRGPIDTQVSLIISQQESKKQIEVQRKNIQIPTVQWEKLTTAGKHQLLYLKARQFNEKLVPETVSILDAHFDSNTQAIVLDLRDNPGGLVPAAVGLAGIFLPTDSVVLSIRHKNKADTILTAQPEDWGGSQSPQNDPIILLKNKYAGALDFIPLYILINESSASASELVSAALKDHKRATIIGTRSFGKGSVQSLLPLGDDDGALKLTTSLYYSPLGTSLQSKGVTPDIQIPIAKDKKIFRESDLPGHLRGPEEATPIKATSALQRKQILQEMEEAQSSDAQHESEELATSIFTSKAQVNLNDVHFIEIDKHLKLRQ